MSYFSSQSKEYALYRPSYPNELFTYISSLVKRKNIVVDCATGSGQAALPLSNYFKQVIGIDISTKQLEYAEKRENIRYITAPVEKIPIPANTVNVITAAQAAHWFSLNEFYREVRRIGRKDAVIVLWGYGLCTISTEIDQLLQDYYTNIVGSYWPSERKQIDDAYKNLSFPFTGIKTPPFQIQLLWTAEQFLAYLFTWSATQLYMKEVLENPLELIKDEVKERWGEGLRPVSWPIFMKAGYVHK